MKNSQKLMLGFAAVAVIVGLIAVNYPPVEAPDAQGSIGAVQKYRDEQIKPADVVLGDEQGRRVESALYGSLLEQATQLQSFSAEIASFSRSIDNREQLAAFEQSLASREDALAKSVMLGVADLQSKEQLASFHTDLQGISRGFDNRANLGMKDLQSFESSLESIEKELEAKVALDSKQLAEAQARLDSFKQLDSKLATLDSMKNDLASRADALQARDQIESRMLDSRMLASRADQLGVRLLEQKALLGLKQELAAIEQNLENRANLGDRAAALDSRSAEFLGLSTRLEARALDNMSARLEARNLEAKSLMGLRTGLESAEQELQSRQDLQSKNLGAMENELQSFGKSLDNREAALNQKFAFGMKSELAAINNQLDNRSNLSAKFNLGSESELAAKSGGLDNRENLANRNNLGQQDTLASFNQYLGSLSRSYESRADLASRESDLGSRAQELQSRTTDLQSKSNF